MIYRVGPRSYDSYLDRDDIRDLHEFQKRHDLIPLPHIAGNRGDRGTYTCHGNEYDLYSYKTHVMHAEVVDNVATVSVLWHSYSYTTMNHINAFLEMLYNQGLAVSVETGDGVVEQAYFSGSEWRKLYAA